MFHNASQAAQLHHITNRDRIFKQQEDTGDHILHQSLATKANRNADHAGTGNQRGDINANFRQHRQHDKNQDDGQKHRAQHGQKGAHPCTLRSLRIA